MSTYQRNRHKSLRQRFRNAKETLITTYGSGVNHTTELRARANTRFTKPYRGEPLESTKFKELGFLEERMRALLDAAPPRPLETGRSEFL